MRVLDVGSGVGGPAREVSAFTDAAEIVGINNNAWQVARAERQTKAAGMESKVKFVKGDYMRLPTIFDENTFDAGSFIDFVHGICTDSCLSAYAFQATPHAPSLEGVYGGIFKVLKPGGVVS